MYVAAMTKITATTVVVAMGIFNHLLCFYYCAVYTEFMN